MCTDAVHCRNVNIVKIVYRCCCCFHVAFENTIPYPLTFNNKSIRFRFR